jgi:hypothetical protein
VKEDPKLSHRSQLSTPTVFSNDGSMEAENNETMLRAGVGWKDSPKVVPSLQVKGAVLSCAG